MLSEPKCPNPTTTNDHSFIFLPFPAENFCGVPAHSMFPGLPVLPNTLLCVSPHSAVSYPQFKLFHLASPRSISLHFRSWPSRFSEGGDQCSRMQCTAASTEFVISTERSKDASDSMHMTLAASDGQSSIPVTSSSNAELFVVISRYPVRVESRPIGGTA